jgi:hypothetical protein
VTLVSTRGFDEVAAIYSGLGRPDDFAALVQSWATARGAEAFDATVAEAAGSARLITSIQHHRDNHRERCPYGRRSVVIVV